MIRGVATVDNLYGMKGLPKYLLWFPFCLLHTIMVQGQNQSVIDSLLQVLETDIPDEHKVDAYVKIASSYMNSDSANTALYGSKAIELAQTIGLTEGTIDPLYPIGVVTMSKGHYDEAQQIFAQMADLALANNYQKGKAQAYYGLGWLNLYLGDFDEALKHLFHSKTIFERLGEKGALALCYNMIGILFDKKGNYNKALDNYFRSLEICEELGRKIGMASCYTNIGIIYKNQGEYEKALDYYMRSLTINKELDRKRGMASNYSNIGVIHFDKGNYEKALEFHFRSLKLKTELGDSRGRAYSYNNLGQTFMKQEDYAQALENYFCSLKINEEIGAQADRAYTLIYIGETYRIQNQLFKAQKYLVEGIDLAKQTGLLHLVRDGAEQMALVENELGNYKKAYKAHILYKEMADSLDNEDRIKKITRLEAEYEFRKEKDSLQFVQQQEMNFLKDKAQRKERRKQVIYMVLGGLLVAGIIFYIAINKIIQKRKFQSLRDRISQDLHDEIGSNLSSISLFGMVAGKAIKDAPEKAQQLLTHINSNATQTIESMNDIVWAIKSENDSMLHLISRVRSYASEIEDTGEWDILIHHDEDIKRLSLDMIQRRNIYLFFREAINNAVKYSEGDSIGIEIKPLKNLISVEIKDNGKGFEPERAGENGLFFGGNGLKNMHKRAEELGGNLKIISDPGQGTSVILTFDPSHASKTHWVQRFLLP